MAKGKREPNVIELEGGQKLVQRGGVFVPTGELDSSLFDDAIEESELLSPELQGVLSELGANDQEAKVTVSRILNGGKKSEWLFETHPADFRIEDVQKEYGAGEYAIRVYGKQKGTNYKVIHANKRILIGPNPDQVRAAREAAKAPALPVVQPSDTARAVADALAPIMAAQTTMLAKMAEAMSGGGSRKAMLEEMQIMATMFRPQNTGADQAGGLSGLQAALSLAKELRGAADSGDPESAPYKVLEKALDVFGPMLTARGAQPKPAALPQPAPIQGAQPEAHEEEAQDVNLIQRAALAGQLAILLTAARNNSDPLMYAGLIYENAPDEVIDKLAGNDWFKELCQLEAGFASFRPWCEQVRAKVMEALDEDARGNLTQEGSSTTLSGNASTPAAPAAPAAPGGTASGSKP